MPHVCAVVSPRAMNFQVFTASKQNLKKKEVLTGIQAYTRDHIVVCVIVILSRVVIFNVHTAAATFVSRKAKLTSATSMLMNMQCSKVGLMILLVALLHHIFVQITQHTDHIANPPAFVRSIHIVNTQMALPRMLANVFAAKKCVPPLPVLYVTYPQALV